VDPGQEPAPGPRVTLLAKKSQHPRGQSLAETLTVSRQLAAPAGSLPSPPRPTLASSPARISKGLGKLVNFQLPRADQYSVAGDSAPV
jgi:hypothetical protein